MRSKELCVVRMPSHTPLAIFAVRSLRRARVKSSFVAIRSVVSANLLHGFEQFNLQNNVRNAFPLTCLSGYVLIPPLLCYVNSAVEGGIYAPLISDSVAYQAALARYEALRPVLTGERSLRQQCEHTGINYWRLWRDLQRFQREGLLGLLDQRTLPHPRGKPP